MQELEQIISLINGLGAEAKDAFIWWLAIKYGSDLISGLMMTAVFLSFFAVAKKLILTSICNDKVKSAVQEELNKDLVYPFDLQDFSGPGKYVAAIRKLRKKAKCSD